MFCCNFVVMRGNCKIYCAPMQGITDHVWRSAHASVFGGVDHYCAPFMRVEHGEIRRRDLRDILPENNSVPVIPQLLACKADDARRLAMTIKEMGYSLIDINLGCPHPPVALRHKGSGMLKYPDEVKAMFIALAGIEGVSYSVKMRLGWDDELQWKPILDLLPIINPQHVTIHPRTGKQQYGGELKSEQFEQLLDICPYPIIYNGEIKTKDDIDNICDRYDKVAGIMIGRGLVSHPHMLEDAVNTKAIRQFHDNLVAEYSMLDGGEHVVLGKLRAMWQYFLPEADRKALKAIKKSKTLNDYNEAAAAAIDSIQTD